VVPELAVERAAAAVSETDADGRLGALVREHFAYIWRLCRRLGLPESDADDAAQQVFITASRRVSDMRGGSERAFLYGVAVNTAAKWRETSARRREEPEAELERMEASVPSAEELLDRRNARLLLDALLDAMPLELRVVFVLYEIEQQTAPEIAEALAIPLGTVASRLRRAREDFAARLARLEARRRFQGTTP
jgi:RNA polymerase sigma-70 factor (ECF subfamily)